MIPLFLDMDGVLCTARSALAFGRGQWKHLDPVACRLLGRLFKKEPNLRVVLSSTWRTHFDRHAMDHILCNGGIDSIPWHDDWRTKDLNVRLSGYVPRGKEIAEWLERNGKPEKYLILDDDNDMLEEQKPFFVRTHELDGISTQNYIDACKILKAEP